MQLQVFILYANSKSKFNFFYLFSFFRKARAGIQEVHFLPFNPTDKRTALTYIDHEGKMHRVSKGAPEQVYRFAFLACINVFSS